MPDLTRGFSNLPFDAQAAPGHRAPPRLFIRAVKSVPPAGPALKGK